jgi:hypothetical protein
MDAVSMLCTGALTKIVGNSFPPSSSRVRSVRFATQVERIDLPTLKLPFGYAEEGENKLALVKVVLHSPKLATCQRSVRHDQYF